MIFHGQSYNTVKKCLNSFDHSCSYKIACVSGALKLNVLCESKSQRMILNLHNRNVLLTDLRFSFAASISCTELGSFNSCLSTVCNSYKIYSRCFE